MPNDYINAFRIINFKHETQTSKVKNKIDGIVVKLVKVCYSMAYTTRLALFRGAITLFCL
jgi:hypothetical protein